MELDQIVQQVQTAVENNDWQQGMELLRPLPIPDLAYVLCECDPDTALNFFRRYPALEQSSIFGYLRPAMQSDLAEIMSRSELTELFALMDHDERADLYNRLSEEERLNILPGLAHAEREDIRTLASYEEGTAGAIMTSAYISLSEKLTASQALQSIREEAPDAETIYQIYIVDNKRKLIGTISLRDLLLAPPNTKLNEIMVTDVIHCQVNDPQSDAAHSIAHYDLISLPVVDDKDRLVGIITHDDALDVTQEESTDDQMRLGAVDGAPTMSLKEATIGMLYRMRVFWLVILVFGNVFSGAGIAYFESLIESMVALVFFLPLLVDSGGNAGSQSATLMVRALATGEVRMRDWFQMLSKEITVALLLGLSMAAAVSLVGLMRGGVILAVIVATTMVLIVMVGSIIGMSLPFVLTRFKMDPASASAPLITSICDAVGVLIYFNVANLLLDMPT